MKVLLLLVITALCWGDVFEVINIARSGMSVQQKKLEVIAENVANLSTAKTSDGQIYKQKQVIVKTNKENNTPYVSGVEERTDTVQKLYDPSNPESDDEGYVYVVDNSLSTELVNMALTRRLYEANAAVFNSAKQAAQTIMNLGK